MSESFGRYLKRERKLREIPLAEIARETKIKVGLLRALEDDRVEELPSPAIVKGFLRAYARMLGLSANDLQLRYQSFLEEVAPDRLRPQSLRPWVPRKRRRMSAVGWLLLIALGIGVGLHLTGSEPARGPQEESTSGADSEVVYRKNYLSEIETGAPPGTPPRIAAASPEWPGPASGGMYVLLRALAPTTAAVSLDGGATQPIVLLPGQPVLRHAFRGMVIDTPEPAFVEVEMNGERLPPRNLPGGQRRIVLRAPELPPTGEESPSHGHPITSLEADASGEVPMPAITPVAGLNLIGHLTSTPAPLDGKRRNAASSGRAESPADEPEAPAKSTPGSPHRPAVPPEIPAAPSNSPPKGR